MQSFQSLVPLANTHRDPAMCWAPPWPLGNPQEPTDRSACCVEMTLQLGTTHETHDTSRQQSMPDGDSCNGENRAGKDGSRAGECEGGLQFKIGRQGSSRWVGDIWAQSQGRGRSYPCQWGTFQAEKQMARKLRAGGAFGQSRESEQDSRFRDSSLVGHSQDAGFWRVKRGHIRERSKGWLRVHPSLLHWGYVFLHPSSLLDWEMPRTEAVSGFPTSSLRQDPWTRTVCWVWWSARVRLSHEFY